MMFGFCFIFCITFPGILETSVGVAPQLWQILLRKSDSLSVLLSQVFVSINLYHGLFTKYKKPVLNKRLKFAGLCCLWNVLPSFLDFEWFYFSYQPSFVRYNSLRIWWVNLKQKINHEKSIQTNLSLKVKISPKWTSLENVFNDSV